MKSQIIWFITLGCCLGLMACQNKKPPAPVSTPRPVGTLQTVYFDFDRSNIRQDQVSTVNNNGDVLRSNSSWRVTIEGHCDERGTNEYNMALGDRRARSARDYVVNTGIDPNRISTVSYGEERPVCHGHDESCWWQNRRGEFLK